MQHKGPTTSIYLLAAAANSGFWLSRDMQAGTWPTGLLSCVFLSVVPLLFAFAYSRILFGVPAPEAGRQRAAAIFHGLWIAIDTFLFAILGSEFWKNPVRDVDSIALLAVPIVAVPVFLIAALSLLLKRRSALAKFASFLFWPYWLLLALLFVGRFFQETLFRTVFCFFCFVAPVLFALAAGGVAYLPTLAHATALAGLIGMPWIYWTTLKGTEISNDWIMFNVPDRELAMSNARPIAALTILSIGLIVLAIATAALRLIPASWKFRELPLCERSWPAFLASFLFLAAWFSHSVIPYRIPGALDYADWPILQILHVEKRGLRFHETCTNVWNRYGYRVSVSENRRRLFQYRFQEKLSEGDLSQPLIQRVQQLMARSAECTKKQGDTIKPVRSWNADNWYFRVQGSSILVYTSQTGALPPLEIISLFHDLETTARSTHSQLDLKDVCMGFCYDPPAALGFLFSNHRCFNDGKRVVCR